MSKDVQWARLGYGERMPKEDVELVQAFTAAHPFKAKFGNTGWEAKTPHGTYWANVRGRAYTLYYRPIVGDQERICSAPTTMDEAGAWARIVVAAARHNLVKNEGKGSNGGKQGEGNYGLDRRSGRFLRGGIR